jgi:6-phosphogluconolactonase
LTGTTGKRMNITEFRVSSTAALTANLADFIENELTEAVATRGYASLVVSGGSTPRPLFEELAQRSLPWNKITVTLADERWIDISSKDSNEAMVRETLLRGAASEAAFIPLKNTAESASEGWEMCHETIADQFDRFDLVILGMGEDGHTASLFPGVSGSALDSNSPALCAAINPPEAPHERMTLTASALLNSRKIILHIVGDKKWQIYQDALIAGSEDELPIRVVLAQDRVPVDVYWSP